MFTYGYIREATLAHLDIDETEAEAMHLLQRFHLYANEAMLAICASKPMYQYIDITVVDRYFFISSPPVFLIVNMRMHHFTLIIYTVALQLPFKQFYSLF